MQKTSLNLDSSSKSSNAMIFKEGDFLFENCNHFVNFYQVMQVLTKRKLIIRQVRAYSEMSERNTQINKPKNNDFIGDQEEAKINKNGEVIPNYYTKLTLLSSESCISHPF